MPKCAAKLFYDPWETESKQNRKRIILEKLDNYIKLAKNLSFYKERLSGYDKNAEEPLGKVSVLTSQDLRTLLPPVSMELLSDKRSAYSVFQSGGTTGRPKTSLFTHEELECLNLPNSRGFYAAGLAKEDRVANLFAVGSLYMTFIHINRMLQQYGCMNFPFSNHTPPDFIHSIIKLFNVNVVTGITSVVLSALREMVSLGLDGIKIDKIFYGGEHIYEADIKELQEKFKVKTVAAPGYGTIDSWYIGYQCSESPLRIFHAHDDQCFIEIVDEESGKECSYGQKGMLYVTAYERKLTPIVRYGVGDLAYWIDEPCSCGRTTPRFKLLGRGDDTLRIGYDFIDYNFIQQLVCKVPKLSGTVQMEKFREGNKDKLVIRVETELPHSEYAKAGKLLEREILENKHVLKKAVAEGSVCPFKIECLPLGSISQNSRTGKLIRVIDSSIENT